MKHTPGPWKLGKCGGSIITNPQPDDSKDVLKFYGGHVVCESISTKADHCLIVAAPELLEALERLVEKYGTGNLRPIDWYHAAQVIQRAKGES